jgi:hypothetical protein
MRHGRGDLDTGCEHIDRLVPVIGKGSRQGGIVLVAGSADRYPGRSNTPIQVNRRRKEGIAVCIQVHPVIACGMHQEYVPGHGIPHRAVYSLPVPRKSFPEAHADDPRSVINGIADGRRQVIVPHFPDIAEQLEHHDPGMVVNSFNTYPVIPHRRNDTRHHRAMRRSGRVRCESQRIVADIGIDAFGMHGPGSILRGHFRV